MQDRPQRKSPRLSGYNYTQSGGYFVTICTHQRASLFGEIINQVMQLNAMGVIAESCWLEIPQHFDKVELDAFVIMPNHMHGIVIIDGEIKRDDVAAGTRHASSLQQRPNGVKAGSLGAIVGSYKAAVSKKIRAIFKVSDMLVWQARYHDHIIRSEESLNHIRDYILSNATSWEKDSFYNAE